MSTEEGCSADKLMLAVDDDVDGGRRKEADAGCMKEAGEKSW